jgi:hypothetical protein
VSTPSNRQISKLPQSMIVERQRLLIREANYLRGLVGLPPVRAEEHNHDASGSRRKP